MRGDIVSILSVIALFLLILALIRYLGWT